MQAPKLVIDGQQRLTTISLLLAALADMLSELPEDQQEPIEDFTPEIIRETYLTRRHHKGEKLFKLLLSDTDRTTLIAVVDPSAAVEPPEPSIRIKENHAFFLEVLGDPNVSQEILKLYITYKAETSFVDIVPQTKRLRLSLNMPFPELDDPKGFATNVAGIGRWAMAILRLGLPHWKRFRMPSA